MPKLPGLTPLNEDTTRTSGGKDAGRLQVRDDIQDPSLRPVASPVDTYFRPPAPQRDNDLTRLADSLSGLSPALMAFGSTMQAQQRQDAPGNVAQKLFGRPLAEQTQILRSDPELQNAASQKLGHAQIGMGTAEETLNEIRTAYTDGTFNKDTDNIQDFANRYIQRDLANNKDPAYAESYRQRILGGLASLNDTQAKYLAERTVQQSDQIVFNSMKATLGQSIDAKATPEQAYAALKQTMATTQAIASKPVEEQEKLLVTNLGRMAAGLQDDPQYEQKYALISGILKADRTGPDGKSRGSMLDDVKLGGAALDIQKAAERVYNQRNELANSGEQAALAKLAVSGDPNFLDGLERMKKDHPQWMSPEKAISLQNTYNHALMKKDAELAQQRAEQAEQNQTNELVRQALPMAAQGKLQYVSPSTIIGADGKAKDVPASDIIDKTVDYSQRDINTRYAGQNTPQARADKLNEEVKLYAENGIVNKAWKGQLEGGFSAASNIVAAGGQIPQGLSEAYELYKNLSAKAPQALGKHISDQDQDFYEVAKVLEQSGNYDPKQAITAAAIATSDPQWKQTRNTLSITRTEERDKAMESLKPGWAHWFTANSAKAVNADQPLGEVLKFAGALNRALKIPIDQAIAKAGEAVASKYTVINGTAIRTGDKNVPPNFGDLANAYIDRWAEDHKADLERAHVTKDDITMVNINNTPNWQIMFRGDPGGVTLPGANFTLRELHDQQERIDAQKRADAQTKFERRNEPLVIFNDPGNSAPTLPVVGRTPRTVHDAIERHDAAKRKYDREKAGRFSTELPPPDVPF